MSDAQDQDPPTDAANAQEPPTDAVFRKPKRNKNVRRRSSTADDEDISSGSAVVRVAKAAKSNPLVQGTAREKDREGLQQEFAHGSDRRIANYDNKATATNEQEVERDRDAQALFEQAQQQWADGGDVASDGTKIYRGQKAYHQYTGKSEHFDGQMMQGHGPARAPVHYRATSRFDYQPDICKDFRDTGYCGYGDACKFLHDRSDYKTGWQLEKDWEDKQRAQKHEEALIALGEQEQAQVEEDSLPFACLICREPWHKRSSPVVTKCEHYFCEACALRNFQKTRRCFACGEQTGGIFNHAKNIQEKINAREEDKEVDEECLSQEQLMAEYQKDQERKANRDSTSGWRFI